MSDIGLAHYTLQGVTAIDIPGHRGGTQGVAAAEPWRAVEQPDLQQALEHAPLLETELLGEPARGVNVWERWMVPNRHGQSWDVLQVYFNELRKTLPRPVSTDAYWPHWVDPSYEYEHLTLGPDGFVWTYLKDVLVRIDPQGVRVHVVGQIAPVGHPTFVGRDIYLSGPERELRRIRHVVPTILNPKEMR